MSNGKNSFLIVIGDREALAWVLSNRRMAFSKARVGVASALSIGDTAYLYTTRGCFRNPTKDRGRVIAEARVTSAVTSMAEPVMFGDQSFVAACDLTLKSLAPARHGVDLAMLAHAMETFRVPDRWSVYLRRPLLRLAPADALMIHGELAAVAGNPAGAGLLDGYRRLGIPPRGQSFAPPSR